MNEIVLEISALGVALFCLIDCLRNRTWLYLPTPKGWLNKLKDQHFVYLSLLFTLIISAMTSTLEVGMEQHFAYKNAFMIMLLNEIYFIVHTALSFLFTLYVINITGIQKNKGKVSYVLFLIPLMISEIIAITNPFTKLLFYIDENLRYNRGPMMWLNYIVAGFYVLYGIFMLIVNRKLISKLDRFATFILMFIAVLGIVIQGAFAINVELFFESIGFLGFMLFLEKGHGSERSLKSEKMSKSFIIVIALVFLMVITMNISLIYQTGTNQTGRIGEIQINNLRGELQQTISDSESYLLRFSLGLDQLINENAGVEEYEEYIINRNEYYKDLTSGACIGAYAASKDWTIIPEFTDMPEDYHAVERIWYYGAVQTPGEIYISEPYIDANTGMLCYTFSNLLSDGKTVVAMDYSLERVQDIVVRMAGERDQEAMIVTDNGIIVGCSEVGYQGELFEKVLPKYVPVFQRVKASTEHRSFKIDIDGDDKIIFSSETNNGWKLILAVDYSAFYSSIFNHMVLLGAIDLLMVAVIIVFYMVSVNNQERAEQTLASTENFIASLSEDLRNPLNEIIRISDTYDKKITDDALKNIGIASSLLKEKMDNLFSYSSILKSNADEEASARNKKRKTTSTSSKVVRNGITLILIAALVVGLAMCLRTTTRLGNSRISHMADKYSDEVTLWMNQKQSILRMFSDVIAANPSVLDDYDSAVKWLDDITKNYPDMTFAYMANPYNKEHAIIMNNGWVPEADYKVEERQWYIDTERSGDGYSISAPYFDAQTGLYCITFSRVVYDTDGQFLGIFAIDCLLDKLIDVLDDSYTVDSYAFMVDQNGTIINHPNKAYEISETDNTNIEDTEYSDLYHKGHIFWMRDYDRRLVTSECTMTSLSGFSVIVVQNWWSIYAGVLIISSIFLLMIAVSIIVITIMMNRFIGWQEEANEKLVLAADRAVSAEKAKSRFLAQMSHEIRTPINTVLGMNEMILRESKESSIRDYAGSIRSAGKNLLGLINSILDFSKIEEGKMEIIPVKYDTATMIGNIINSISKRASDKGLVFEAHVDPELPSSLFGDDMRVTQVVVNLLTNAVKYTREGRVDLYINGIRTGDENINVRMRVEDTGIGIKDEDKDKLFESFTRLDETRNRNIEGTGLGMAIVNKLLEMMGSSLEVESVYGEGSKFSFEVTQKIVDASPIGDYEAKSKEAMERDDEDRYIYAPKARLLVVDDNEMNLMVIEKLLKLNGIKPDLAFSGKEALEKMADNIYDVIMLDHMMPEMDGVETLHEARDKGLINEGCSVIALTANAVVGARESYLEEGFDDYLSKPVEIPLMEAMLGKYLPPEMVSYKRKSVESTEPKIEVPVERVLSVGSIDTASGMTFCAGDEEFYHKMLREYIGTHQKRIEELNEALKENDMGSYAIKVHALKSVSKTIGAKGAFEAAAELEKAAKEGDTETVKAGHDRLVDIVKKVIVSINELGITEAEAPPDEEILEFMPE